SGRAVSRGAANVSLPRRLGQRRRDPLYVDARCFSREHPANIAQQLQLGAAVDATAHVRHDRGARLRVEAVVEQLRQLVADARVCAIIHRETPSQRASRCDNAPGRRLPWFPPPRRSPCTTALRSREGRTLPVALATAALPPAAIASASRPRRPNPK